MHGMQACRHVSKTIRNTQRRNCHTAACAAPPHTSSDKCNLPVHYIRICYYLAGIRRLGLHQLDVVIFAGKNPAKVFSCQAFEVIPVRTEGWGDVSI